MRLLIAEDDRASRAILEHMAKGWGYAPTIAADGEEAWDVLTGPDVPELALLDWEMPGMSGIEICRRLRERPGGPGTYLILLTSKAQSGDVVAGLAAGADDYLTKPYDRNELQARLNAGRRISRLQADLAGRLEEIEGTLLCLQEAFLYGQAPMNLPGLEVVARTVPHEQVAGDFHDFHAHGDDVLDIVVGDVMGKGVRASLLGAALATRFLRCLREHAAASRSAEPPPLRELLADVRNHVFPQFLETESFATVCYARVDCARGRLEIVDCGHPPLIHVSARTGKADLVRGSNMPLGFSRDEEPAVVSRRIGPGDLVVLHSDGITEAMGPDGAMYGEKRLADSVQRRAGAALGELVDGVLADMSAHAAGSAPADDISCVALRVRSCQANAPPTPPGLAHEVFETVSDLAELATVRSAVRRFCQGIPGGAVGPAQLDYVELGLNEAVANIIRHAYGSRLGQPITIDFLATAAELRIVLLDSGLPFSPDSVPPPVLDGTREGGFGVFIIRQCFDEVEYRRDERGRNRLELRLMLNTSRSETPPNRTQPEADHGEPPCP